MSSEMFLQVVCVTNWLNNCFCIFQKFVSLLLFSPVIFHNIISRFKLKLHVKTFHSNQEKLTQSVLCQKHITYTVGDMLLIVLKTYLTSLALKYKYPRDL